MYVLRPGATLSLHQIQPFILGTDGARELLDVQDASQVEALCLGAESLSPVGRILADKGLVTQSDSLVDEVLLSHLRRLDRMYAWWDASLTPRQCRAFELTRLAHASRKRFLWSAGQCPTLPETSFRRALLTPEDPPRRVLCIGDDDLVCIPLAALGHRVTVFDLDDYLMRLIDRIAAEHDLAIETVPHDLHEPVPEEYGEAFDVFYTDPCSNEACLTLFLSRGIGCLREGGAGHVAVMHPAETLYRRLTEQMGFPVTGFQHDFNHYYWASMRLAYYISDEYSHRKTSDTTPARLLCESFETAEELFDDFLTPDSHPYAVDFTEIDAARADAEDVASLLGRALDLAGETIHDTGELLTYSANRVRGGYINLLIDRPRRFMKLTLMPLDLSEERRARHALVEHFGGKALTNRTSSGPEIEQF